MARRRKTGFGKMKCTIFPQSFDPYVYSIEMVARIRESATIGVLRSLVHSDLRRTEDAPC